MAPILACPDEAHMAERAAQGGLPPLALDASQATSVVEMLKNLGC